MKKLGTLTVAMLLGHLSVSNATTISAVTPITGKLATNHTQGRNYFDYLFGVIELEGEEISAMSGTYCMYWRETDSKYPSQEPSCGALTGDSSQRTEAKSPTSYAIANLEVTYRYSGSKPVRMTVSVRNTNLPRTPRGEQSVSLEGITCAVDVNTRPTIPVLNPASDVDIPGIISNSVGAATVTFKPGLLSAGMQKGILTLNGNTNGYYAINNNPVDSNGVWVVDSNSNPRLNVRSTGDAEPGEMTGFMTATIACP